MGRRKKQSTRKEFVEAFFELFGELESESPEEIDSILREAGYDPDEVGARMQRVAEEALEKAAKKVKAGLQYAGSG